MGATERIKQYIDFKGITKYKFSKNLGFSNKFLDNSSNMGTDKACKIIQYYSDINPEWLLTGKGEMIKGNNTNETLAVSNEKMPTIIEINSESKTNTLIADTKASAGFGTILDNPKKLQELPAISLPNAPFGLNVAFQIDGDSMHPTIRHLDFVAANQLNSVNDIRDGYTYIIIDKDDGVLCKRIYREGADFKIVSDNPSYPPYKRSQYDILAFFRCFMRLSTDFRTYHDDVRNAIENLQIEVQQIKHQLST